MHRLIPNIASNRIRTLSKCWLRGIYSSSFVEEKSSNVLSTTSRRYTSEVAVPTHRIAISESDKTQESVVIDNESNEGHFKYFQNLIASLDEKMETLKLERHKTDALPKEFKLPENPNDSSATNDRDNVLMNEESSINGQYLATSDTLSLDELKVQLPPRSSTLAPYARDSITLQKLVALGIDLSIVERDFDISSFLLRADFESDIQPYLLFLNRIGIDTKDFACVLQKNMYLFKEDIENLQIRINYLTSKKFGSDAIARIVTKCPAILSKSTRKVDAQLGFLQKHFELTGDQIRTVVAKHPKIAVFNTLSIQHVSLMMKTFCGMTNDQQRTILLEQPKVYLASAKKIQQVFSYVHFTMGINKEQIIAMPDIFRTKPSRIKARHRFLQHIKRDQFNPSKPNYVSLKALVSSRDRDFCFKVAKRHVKEFDEFLKTS